jgi:hypothetical protein
VHALQALGLLYLNARALRTHALHTHTAHANLNIAGPDRSSEIIGAWHGVGGRGIICLVIFFEYICDSKMNMTSGV